MKVAFGMIVFEGDYVLHQCLEQIYPFAEQILIAEGAVSYWQKQGRTTSSDLTNNILDLFPDPDNKIITEHGAWKEKDQQCAAYMKHIRPDIDYLWMIDSDEVYKTKDIENILAWLEKEKPSKVAMKPLSFVGGFERYMTGFEQRPHNFKRIFKYEPNAVWGGHRPPRLKYRHGVKGRYVDGNELFGQTGACMYHYSYVFPRQVKNKFAYYKKAVSKNNSLDNYFEDIWLPWVKADTKGKLEIEKKYNGIHHFKPSYRGSCYTTIHEGNHPEAIERDKDVLKLRIEKELWKN